jgi:hypothetical protein
MGRLCTICCHPRRTEIDAAVLAHLSGFRPIAARFQVDPVSLRRHTHNHLAAQVQQAAEARALASTESLIAELNTLHAHARSVLVRAEQARDDKLILLALREGRADVEALARLAPLQDVDALGRARGKDWP